MIDFGLVLEPIVWLMEQVLWAYVSLTQSAGAAIVLLSVTFSLLLWPLQRLGLRAERKHVQKADIVNQEVRLLRAEGLKGERLFDATEVVYRRHGYHPIQAVLAGASFLSSLPVLLSSLILFHRTPLVEGQPFLFVPDLGRPDAMLAVSGVTVNLLPFLMFAITSADAWLRYRHDAGARRRFLFISTVLLALVYGMPAGLVLYWSVSSALAFAMARIGRGGGDAAYRRLPEGSRWR